MVHIFLTILNMHYILNFKFIIQILILLRKLWEDFRLSPQLGIVRLISLWSKEGCTVVCVQFLSQCGIEQIRASGT